IPGEVDAPEWGDQVRITFSNSPCVFHAAGQACLRAWKPGDPRRVRYSGGAGKVKEVLERMHVTGSARANWPVLELDGRIAWMQGVQLEPEPGIDVSVSPLLTGPDAAGPG